jgi:hypothetical protein
MPGQSPRWNVLRGNGLVHENLDNLVERLQDDLSVEDSGFPAFFRIADGVQRAVVSDQICQSAFSISENLLEARLHSRQLEAITEEIRVPNRETAEVAVLRGAEMDMAITGSVRALGSTLDCLAATTIGVLRMPTSMTKASFGGLARNFPKTRHAKAANTKQARAWGDWGRLVDGHWKLPPVGWFDWLDAMRNLNVHRGRQIHVLMQRLRAPEEPQLLVFDQEPKELTVSAALFDLHLRNRPGLPDMQDLITADEGRVWLGETADVTLAGLLSLVLALVEEASQFLLSWWAYAEKWGAFFPPPVEAWALEEEPEPFKGVLGIEPDYPAGFGMVGAHLAKRLELANKLRS